MLPLPQFREEWLPVIEDFIRVKVEDSGANGVVVGLSGGIDSSVVTCLCARALSADKVWALILPETATPEEDTKDAVNLAKVLGVNYVVRDIGPIVESIRREVEFVKFPDNSPTHANLKARTRMIILYTFANANNLLVAGTSNKSELMLGYFTKYGDGASDIAPIGDLYKTQVRKCAQALGLGDGIVRKAPTAGLIPGIKDSDELGYDYEVLDRVLYALERYIGVEEIASASGLTPKAVLEIKERMERNRHKRKGPKIPKLGLHTVGLDRRE